MSSITYSYIVTILSEQLAFITDEEVIVWVPLHDDDDDDISGSMAASQSAAAAPAVLTAGAVFAYK